MSDRFWLMMFLELPVLLGGWIAGKEGYLFADQVIHAGGTVPRKFLTYAGHAGVIVLFVLTCPLQGLIIDEYGDQWNVTQLFSVLLVAIVVAALIQQGWIDDPVPSALVRDGLRMPGALNMISMAIVFTVATMYYVPSFTPHVDTGATWIVSAILTTQLLAGILLPPLFVHGSIHTVAWAQAIGGSLIVLGLHLWRIH